VCLFAVYFRPQELYPEFLQIPNLMDIRGGLAIVATLLDILTGALRGSHRCGPSRLEYPTHISRRVRHLNTESHAIRKRDDHRQDR
jgi:hypothetical protein